MNINKTVIAHILSELLIIGGVSYFFHRKCTFLQQQIDEMQKKIDKLGGQEYLNSLKRQETFETQTVQHINKLYSILNTFKMNSPSNLSSPFSSFPMENNMSTTGFASFDKQEKQITNSTNTTTSTNATPANPFLSTLSMMGPLTSVISVMMDKKPHPSELFADFDKQKIEVVDDDDNPPEVLDKEIENELQDLQSLSLSPYKTKLVKSQNTPSSTVSSSTASSSSVSSSPSPMSKMSSKSSVSVSPSKS
jgi:hypothetical protein